MPTSKLIDELVRITAFHSWLVEDEAYRNMLRDLKELVTKAYQQGQRDMVDLVETLLEELPIFVGNGLDERYYERRSQEQLKVELRQQLKQKLEK